jgi:hypothetical protein
MSPLPGMLAPDSPELQARQQGLLGVDQPPGTPPMGFQGGDMNALYGLMAKHSADPSQVIGQYVNSQQNQQRIDQYNDPMERYQRMYGAVNPFDWTAQSLQKYHEHFVKTGERRFDFLVEKEKLSSAEQGFLNTYIGTAQQAESDLGRMNDIAARYQQAAIEGIAAGVPAKAFELMKSVVGGEDATTQLRTEYEQLRMKGVLSNLPAGPATDKDVAIAQKGWPQPTASPAYIASFLRGMQKLRAIDAAQAAHSAAYLSMHQRETGMLEDWNKRRAGLIADAWAPYGGVYNPMNPETGKPYSDDEAAVMYFKGQYVGAGAHSGAGPSVSPVPTDPADKEALINRWLGGEQ